MIKKAMFCCANETIKTLLGRILGKHSHDHSYRWSHGEAELFVIFEFIHICKEVLKFCQAHLLPPQQREKQTDEVE